MKKILLIIVIVLILGIVFFPKIRIYPGLVGMIGPSARAYAVEYDCLGFKTDVPMQVFDGPSHEYRCYGLLYNKKCFYEQVMDNSTDKINIKRDRVDCKSVKNNGY